MKYKLGAVFATSPQLCHEHPRLCRGCSVSIGSRCATALPSGFSTLSLCPSQFLLILVVQSLNNSCGVASIFSTNSHCRKVCNWIFCMHSALLAYVLLVFLDRHRPLRTTLSRSRVPDKVSSIASLYPIESIVHSRSRPSCLWLVCSCLGLNVSAGLSKPPYSLVSTFWRVLVVWLFLQEIWPWESTL